MERQIKSILTQYTRGKDAKLLLALSGGRDSVALCHLLRGLRQELGFTLVAAHLNHGIRGKAADGDQGFVQKLCQRWRIPCYTTKEDIPALGGNLEQTARTRRYAWLRQQKEALGADWIVTAHHAADQGETVLLHLLRGAGLEGLAAMAIAEGDLLRPMLAVSPEDIAAYCRQHRLVWRHDATNDDTRYTRNRLRLELMPQLAAYNPNVLQALGSSAAICRQDNDLLTRLTLQAAATWLQEQPGQVTLAADALRLLHPALAARLLRHGYGLLTGGSTALTYGLCQQALALAPGKELTLTAGVYCRRSQEGLRLALTKPVTEQNRPWGPIAQPLPGELTLAEAGLGVKATLVNLPQDQPGEGEKALLLPYSWGQDLYWRSRRPGDVFRPRNLGGRQKLKEFMIDRKIPAKDRDKLPLLCRKGEIIWLPGWRQGTIPPPQGAQAWWIQVFSL